MREVTEVNRPPTTSFCRRVAPLSHPVRVIWKEEYGDLPTWGALLGALAILIVELRRDRRDKRREESRRNEEAAVERRRQATSVAGWIQRVSTTNALGQSVLRWNAQIRNGSSLPVYDLAVVIVQVAPDPVKKVPLEFSLARLEVVPPDETTIVEVPAVVSAGMTQGADQTRFAVQVAFRDSAGHRWMRDTEGILHEVLT